VMTTRSAIDSGTITALMERPRGSLPSILESVSAPLPAYLTPS
jgi:hypothetical protein